MFYSLNAHESAILHLDAGCCCHIVICHLYFGRRKDFVFELKDEIIETINCLNLT